MRNLTFDEIEIGRPRTISRLLSRPDIEALAFAAGTFDTFELDGNGDRSAESVQAVSAATLIVHLVNRQFPGAGSVIVEESFAFDGALKTGDTVVATLTPIAKDAARRAVTLECAVDDGAGHRLLAGRIVVLAPSVGGEQPESAPTEVIFRRTDALGRLIRRAAQGAPIPTAIVHPCDRDSLLGAVEAARRGLIEPVLVGPEARIRATALAAEVDLAPYRIVGVEHSHAAAARAVALALAGEVAALMKGSLHTDELMAAVVARDGGLRTARRISHVFLLDVPSYPRLLLVTDAAVNVAPDVALPVAAPVEDRPGDPPRPRRQPVVGPGLPRPVDGRAAAVPPDLGREPGADAAVQCRGVERHPAGTAQQRGAIVAGGGRWQGDGALHGTGLSRAGPNPPAPVS